jgi:hypothetical protein
MPLRCSFRAGFQNGFADMATAIEINQYKSAFVIKHNVGWVYVVVSQAEGMKVPDAIEEAGRRRARI